MMPRLVRLLPALLLALCACGPLPLTFTTQVQGESTIEGDPSPLGGLLSTFPGFSSFGSLDFDAQQDFQNQGVTKEQVRSVKVQAMRLTILSPDTQDFRFLDEVEFRARVGERSVPVARKSGIAQLDLSAPNPVLELEVTGEELVDLAAAPSMAIEVSGSGRLPPQDTRLEATVQLKVVAEVL